MMFYKYRNFSDKHVYNIIRNNSLYFSPIHNFNDPFDCRLSFRQSYSKQEIRDFFIGVQERNPEKNVSLKNLMKKYGKHSSFIEMQNSINEGVVSPIPQTTLNRTTPSTDYTDREIQPATLR